MLLQPQFLLQKQRRLLLMTVVDDCCGLRCCQALANTHGSSHDKSLFNGSSVSANARAISHSRPRRAQQRGGQTTMASWCQEEPGWIISSARRRRTPGGGAACSPWRPPPTESFSPFRVKSASATPSDAARRPGDSVETWTEDQLSLGLSSPVQRTRPCWIGAEQMLKQLLHICDGPQQKPRDPQHPRPRSPTRRSDYSQFGVGRESGSHTHTCSFCSPMKCVFHASDAFRDSQVSSVSGASSTLVFQCSRPSVHHFSLK